MNQETIIFTEKEQTSNSQEMSETLVNIFVVLIKQYGNPTVFSNDINHPFRKAAAKYENHCNWAN